MSYLREMFWYLKNALLRPCLSKIRLLVLIFSGVAFLVSIRLKNDAIICGMTNEQKQGNIHVTGHQIITKKRLVACLIS